MIRIIADDKIPFLKGVLEPFAEVIYRPGKLISRNAAQNADALLVRTRTCCDEKLLQDTPVQFIATATIGFDHIDTGYCEKHGIRWTNAPGCNASSVTQYIAAALLSIAQKDEFLLREKTIGIVGVGNVGSKIEHLARSFGMQILLNDPPRERKEGHNRFVTLEKVLKESDILSLHVPLTKEGPDRTFHLINRETIGVIKPNAWLINTSRGEVAETLALREALSAMKVAGSVLDVWEGEPMADPGLIKASFLATPHIAGYSAEGKANGTAMIIRELARHFHLPLNDWYPRGLPEPIRPEIIIHTTNKSPQAIIKEAVLLTYPIRKDDEKFRADPASFEFQRENYPVRREFPAFRVKLENDTGDLAGLFRELGFSC